VSAVELTREERETLARAMVRNLRADLEGLLGLPWDCNTLHIDHCFGQVIAQLQRAREIRK